MPEFLSTLDLKTIGGWLALLGFLLWHHRDDIKRAVARLYQDKQLDSTDRREANQNLQQAQVDFAFQDRATRALMEQQAQETAFAIVKETIQWSREDFSDMRDTLEELVKGIERLQQTMQDIAASFKEQNQDFNKQTRRLDGIDNRLTGLTGIVAQIQDTTRGRNSDR